ncbi:hypothetical protein AB0I68_38580 [Streptomyces sp. NPDC050448]|uniref:hypothetical protein n=1 Tax=Streptomyces sp. NPDC050448 TaxID=3155404 RepID=UPI0034469004
MTTEFADEARSRVARLLRMAADADDRVRDRIVAYAASTPDPPPYGPDGIRTTGCPRCLQTMWMQRDVWVCSSCGHVRDDRVTCHRCGTPMYELDGYPEKWWCRCGAWCLDSESLADIKAREAETDRVMAMLDAVIEGRGAEDQRHVDRQTTDRMEADMGQTIQSRGCSNCGGTMYRCVETDSHGNPTNVPVFICNNCGHQEG